MYHIFQDYTARGEEVSLSFDGNRDINLRLSLVIRPDLEGMDGRESGSRLQKKNILVVDDDISVLLSLKAILEAEGYSVDTAETGQEAIEKSNKKDYNMALLDIKLPDIEGTEIAAVMRKTKPRMKKIMITGYATVETAIESLRLGVDDYVMKPVDPRILLKVIEEKLKEQETEEVALKAIGETLLTEFPELHKKIRKRLQEREPAKQPEKIVES